MAPTSNEPTASVSFLPLSQGLYLFSVRSEHSTRQTGEQPTLPAMQVTAAPGTHPGQIEFMMGGSTTNGWLTDWNDQIVAKVNGPSVLVSLMSVLMPGMIPLEIEIQRLDQPRGDSASSVEAPPRQELPPLPTTEKSLPLSIVAHVQNQGDMDFSEEQWIGLPGLNLWIESLAISPKAGLSPDLIEYQAITATGVETPWVTGGTLCGTRGIGVPITGFALRGKPHSANPELTCEYGAICLSGAMVGPVRNGAVCSSDQANDPITGIWIGISGAGARAAETMTSVPLSSQKPDSRPMISREQPMLASSVAETPQKPKKPRVGPRFSVFREAAQTENE
jgi:hypothetical protein